MTKASKELTGRQKLFVENFLATGNGTQAAIAAGYAESGARVRAHRLTKDSRVQKALQARQSADATRLSTQREDVIQGLLEAIQDAKAQRDPVAMISGYREIGRMLGFYAPDVRRVQVSADRKADDELRRYDAMSDAELMAIVAGGVA